MAGPDSRLRMNVARCFSANRSQDEQVLSPETYQGCDVGGTGGPIAVDLDRIFVTWCGQTRPRASHNVTPSVATR
jgi:hypothetical protein